MTERAFGSNTFERLIQGSQARVDQVEAARQAFSLVEVEIPSVRSYERAGTFAAMTLFLIMLSTACGGKGEVKKDNVDVIIPQITATFRQSTPETISTPDEILSRNDNGPVWQMTDLEQYTQEKLWGGKGTFCLYESEESGQPLFYKGSIPLNYRIAYAPERCPGSGSGELPTFYEFEDFENYFIYQGPIIVGAQTYQREPQGLRLVAEVSNINYFVTDDNEQGLEIEELHYNSQGKLTFKCKSQIDFDTGFKINESEKSGEKEEDYYFIWPVNIP